MVRTITTLLTNLTQNDIHAIPTEIGSSFSSKTIIYLKPLTTILSKKSGHPMKMTMTHKKVIQASGPTSDSKSIIKISTKKNSSITTTKGIY